MRQALRNDEVGRYLVTTATGSQYCLDLDKRTATRRMAASPPIVDVLDVGVSRLRRDGETLELLMIDQCRVGEPAKLWLQVRDDHVFTLRTTSPVLRIEPLGDADLDCLSYRATGPRERRCS